MIRYAKRTGTTTNRVTNGRRYKFVNATQIIDDNGNPFKPCTNDTRYWVLIEEKTVVSALVADGAIQNTCTEFKTKARPEVECSINRTEDNIIKKSSKFKTKLEHSLRAHNVLPSKTTGGCYVSSSLMNGITNYETTIKVLEKIITKDIVTINDENASDISTDTLIEIIQDIEEQVSKLEKMSTESKTVGTLLKRRSDVIKKLVEILDDREKEL